MKPGLPSSLSRRAFTLLELLAVMAIVLLLMTLTQMALGSLSQSTKLTTGAQMLGDLLNGARQAAVAHGQYVQVRLCFNPGNPDRISAVAIFRADSPLYGNSSDYQAWEAARRFRQEGRIRKLQEPISIVQSAKYSTLLEEITPDAHRKGSGLKIDGRDHDWVAFYFRPDGAMDVKLPAGASESFLTLTLAVATAADSSNLVNYATVAINPVNGRYRTLRP
jgi:uncharacterized protein (TIGR02596 family)